MRRYPVRHLKAAVLAEVLYPVDKLSGHSLIAELRSNGDIQGNSQLTLRRHQSSGHILGCHLIVGRFQRHIPRRQMQHIIRILQPCRLNSRNILLRKSGERSSYLLHLLAVALSECLEIRFDLLGNQTCCILDIFYSLYIDLIEHQTAHLLELLLDLRVEDGDNHPRKRLTHLDIDLAAQGENHRG